MASLRTTFSHWHLSAALIDGEGVVPVSLGERQRVGDYGSSQREKEDGLERGFVSLS